MANSIEELSDRELEILRLLATGVSNKEIASQLYISPNTVKVHLRNIFTKLDVTSRTEAAMAAVNAGIVNSIPVTSEIELSEQPEEGIDKRISYKGIVRFVILGFVLLAVALGAYIYFDNQNESTLPTISDRGWNALKEMPTARYDLAAAAYDNAIYAIAGHGIDGVTGVVERYHPESDTWDEVASKPTPVDQVQAAVLGGKIYVPGGRLDSGDATDIMEIYDPKQDSWSRGKSLPVSISAYALAAFEGRLYVFGGWDGKNYYANVYSYDPASEKWREEPDMPTARAFIGAAVAGRKIYVLGGYDGEKALDVNEAFSPDVATSATDAWSQAKPMPEARYAMGVASVADMIYVVGGEGEEGENIYDSLVFVEQNGQWQEISGIPEISEKSLSLINLGVDIFVIGGRIEDIPQRSSYSYKLMYIVTFPIIVK